MFILRRTTYPLGRPTTYDVRHTLVVRSTPSRRASNQPPTVVYWWCNMGGGVVSVVGSASSNYSLYRANEKQGDRGEGEREWERERNRGREVEIAESWESGDTKKRMIHNDPITTHTSVCDKYIVHCTVYTVHCTGCSVH